jgi:hypothetical protein
MPYIRYTSSPHWRMWLKPENRCLVPAGRLSKGATIPHLQLKQIVVADAWMSL